MAGIPELLDGHVTLEMECLDRLYLNGSSGGLVTYMREQTGKVCEAVKRWRIESAFPSISSITKNGRMDDIANYFGLSVYATPVLLIGITVATTGSISLSTRSNSGS